MAVEIERKFLVVSDQWREHPATYFCQGYLNRDKNRTVRVRVTDDQGWMTIKGLNQGFTREEFEYEIPVVDAKAILQLCEKPLIEKNRRVIPFEGLDWEIDEFLGANEGLVIAEVELDSESQLFKRPDWVGEEVSDDPRYFNANLSSVPYSTWPENQ